MMERLIGIWYRARRRLQHLLRTRRTLQPWRIPPRNPRTQRPLNHRARMTRLSRPRPVLRRMNSTMKMPLKPWLLSRKKRKMDLLCNNIAPFVFLLVLWALFTFASQGVLGVCDMGWVKRVENLTLLPRKHKAGE